MISLTDWTAGMAWQPWALECQLSHDITQKLESRNDTAIMSLGIPATTWYHLLPGEQEWHSNHEPWNPSYGIISLTAWRAGMAQKPSALESQLSHDITHRLESRNGNHEPWNSSYDIISLTDLSATMAWKPWAFEFQQLWISLHFLIIWVIEDPLSELIPWQKYLTYCL